MVKKSETQPTRKKRSKKNYKALRQAAYESLRWITVALLPTLGVVIATLNDTWGWNLPAQEITTTLDVIGMALGALFLGSKIVTDQHNA